MQSPIDACRAILRIVGCHVTLTVQIRDQDLQEALQGEASGFQQRAILEVVLELYERGVLPAGKAMALAGLTRRELVEAMQARDKHLPSDSAEIERDLEWCAGDRSPG